MVTFAAGMQAPRVRSVPRFRKSRGLEAVEVAADVGLILDPWQQTTLVDACGVRTNGKWAAFEVAGNVARQNGKGGIIEARELAGIFAWGERLLTHSAHEFATSMEAFLRMEEYLAGTPEYATKVKSISRSHGHEGFVFKSGQRLRYRTRTKGGGRGHTGDTLILDEAMILQEAFIGALIPTLSGRSVVGNPQVWYMGSAVDQLVHEHGIVFARLRERALAGGDPSLAYFEWSAGPINDDGEPYAPDQVPDELLEDESVWAEANPGLGIRISPEYVENERRAMAARTFAVERLGIGDWPATEVGERGPIGIDCWDSLTDEYSKIVGAPAFAFDVTPDRRSASIVVAGTRQDGLPHVELVDRRAGTGWLVARLAELNARHRPVAVVCDGASPAASLIPELAERGIEVRKLDAREHANACGLLFDTVEQERLRHLGTRELRAAVKGASTRPLGDAWAWSRKNSGVDISPLVACTLALWGALTEPKVQVFAGAW